MKWCNCNTKNSNGFISLETAFIEFVACMQFEEWVESVNKEFQEIEDYKLVID